MLQAYLLKMALRYAWGDGADGLKPLVQLAWIMKEYQIPRSTYYRAINALIQQGFIERVGRDKYQLYIQWID
jgi:DNA-binding IclR family transcriptional regulator